MKRFLFGFLAIFFLLLNTLPYLHIMADDLPTSSQYEMLGAYALSTLITSGEATELDFSDYIENDTSFLIDLGEAIFTGDWSGLAEDGLEWLGETADSVYDSYKEYVSQWKSEHLGIMYSNWFPDETIYVGPDDSYSLAKPLRVLLTPRDSSTPTPQPDPDFSFIQNVNTCLLNTSQAVYDFNSFTWAKSQYGSQYNFVNPPGSSTIYGSYLGDSHSSNGADTIYCSFLIPIVTINVDSSNPTNVIATYSSFGRGRIVPTESTGALYLRFAMNSGGYPVYYVTTDQYHSPQTTFSGLSSCINYIYTNFANINLYVDGVPWVLFSYNGPSYPIVIPGQLTIYNNEPLEYTFPADTHIDLPDLTNIIRNAINSSGVVMWSDIADVFVDINDQTAVAVTKIIRNDYDNLYQEQYPYPAMLIGMTDNTKFNEHLLDNSQGYLSPMVDVVEETVSVLPAEIIGVLAIGAILTIFAVIINRLLE